MKEKNNQVVNLLWTGGWDSTFRLMQLLLLHKKIVQPYYLIDPDRSSTAVEIRTMRNIKKYLFSKYPKVTELLLPTIFKEISDIQPNKNLTDSFEKLLKDKYIGSQYEFIARFCDEIGINNMELSVEIGGNSEKFLKPYLTQSETEKDIVYVIDSKYAGFDIHVLFKYFKLPIFYLSKMDMENIAINENFVDILDLTWFCHNPTANFKPCGVCTPCVDAMKRGMTRRMPISSQIRYYFRIRSRLRNLSWKYPKFYKFMRKWKKRIF